MRIISILAMTVIAIYYLPISAAIINVPDDYGSIQEGIDAAADGDTVLVQPGTYVDNVNFNGHNIVVGSLFLTTGDTAYIPQTRIDGNSAGSVVTFENGENRSAVLIGFILQNGYAEFGGGIFCSGADPTISYNVISGNSAFSADDGRGGGVFCLNSNMILERNVIKNNYCSGPLGGYGGGIYCGYFAPTIKGNIIKDNLGDWAGGGVYFEYCDAVFSQNIVANNTATVYGGGMLCYASNTVIRNVVCTNNESSWAFGGGLFSDASIPIIVNSIFWGDSAFGTSQEIYVESGEPVISYSDLEGGWYQGEGILDVEPFFRDPDNGDFHLMSTDCGDSFDSPCIDAGSPDILDSLLDCDWGLGALQSDMGAYGGWDSVVVGINDPDNAVPGKYAMSQNYPNPFNATTTIRYNFPELSDVAIEIYDILGCRVAALVKEKQAPGFHSVIWNAKDNSSGIYYYRIQAGDFAETRKMLLLK